jgi:hypothetical protein
MTRWKLMVDRRMAGKGDIPRHEETVITVE